MHLIALLFEILPKISLKIWQLEVTKLYFNLKIIKKKYLQKLTLEQILELNQEVQNTLKIHVLQLLFLIFISLSMHHLKKQLLPHKLQHGSHLIYQKLIYFLLHRKLNLPFKLSKKSQIIQHRHRRFLGRLFLVAVGN